MICQCQLCQGSQYLGSIHLGLTHLDAVPCPRCFRMAPQFTQGLKISTTAGMSMCNLIKKQNFYNPKYYVYVLTDYTLAQLTLKDIHHCISKWIYKWEYFHVPYFVSLWHTLSTTSNYNSWEICLSQFREENEVWKLNEI